MGGWLGDLKVSIRQLTKTPGFTAAAVVVLALGIGLNAAMFSVVYAISFMGRAYPASGEMVQLYSSRTRETDSYRAFSFAAWRDISTAGSDVFDGVLAHAPTLVGIGEGAGSRRAFAGLVSRNYFEVLGAPIARGRGFTEEECLPGRDIPVVVVSWSYWQRSSFDGDLVGRTIRVNERDYTVIGVAPRGFTGTMAVFGPELYFPLGVFDSLSNDFQGKDRRTLERADAFNLFLAARLKNGVKQSTAATRLELIGPALERAFPAEYRDARVTLATLPRIGTSTSPMNEGVLVLLGVVLLGLSGAVLLTVCLNLAALLLARGRARRKEFAIRLALGGGRLRIVRQLLLEGFLLALAGGAFGIALGAVGLDALTDALAARLPVTLVLDGALSPALMGATLLFCLIATAWFALGPALRHSRADVVTHLKPHAGEDEPARRRRFRPRHPLVVAQVSLSLALLIAAGLFVRMAAAAMSIDLGYRANDTVLAEVDGSLAGYDTPQMLDLYGRIERRLAALPGVRSASVGALVPLGMVNISRSIRRGGIRVPAGENPETPEAGRAFSAPWNAVGGGYFEAMGIALLRGRTFTDVESFVEGARPVAVIDDTLARSLWPDGGALGQSVSLPSGRDGVADVVCEVVGIVSSAHRQLFEREMPGAIYVPFAQDPMGNASFHVRPAGPSPELAETVSREIRAEAPGLPLFTSRTFAQHIDSSSEHWLLKLSATLLGVFGGLAVVVALVGIYGVMSYAVVRRTREIGIRMAIGALPQSVAGMILGESLSITVAGVVLGWLLGLGVGQVLSNLIVDVSAFDLAVFLGVPAAFVAAALLAAWLPARRATRVDPMQALRAE